MTRYTDENGREQFTEFGGGSDNSRSPDGRRIPLTASQEALRMRRAGLAERIGEQSVGWVDGRQTGQRTFRPR
ncbi:MAG: hypothetical protein JWO18_1138 [Microbacteriaceae bacterium]|nr:hypothetical protein [Microbacteriaceae bacterium]